jgi:putative hydrolase of the HAD superfamily
MSARDGRSGGVQGLLIDYGGVLTNAVGPVMAAFCRSKGLPEDALAALQRPESAFRRELEAYERGEYEDAEFLPRFAAALGLSAHDMDDFLVDVRPDDRMFRAVAALRNHGIRVGLLSNSWAMSAYPRELLAGALDGVVISGEVGMRKPEPRIYRHAAQVIGVEPSSCLFVDDTTGHLAVAAEVGMTVIHHEDAAQTLKALERLFQVDLGTRPGDPLTHSARRRK